MSQSIDLSPIIRAIDGVARELGHDINVVSGQVGQVAQDLDVTNTQLLELRRRFEDYVELQTRANAVQKASTEIVGLKAQMDREFGNHQVVRDSTIGTLQALDVGIVTTKTVQRVSEELMISTPKYWLAPAIVALAAWIRDDQELADKAVAESYRRHPTKCALLFTLVLARQGRLEPSAHWLQHYFNGLDPQNLPRDFAVVMEGASRDAFGPMGRSAVELALSEWLTVLRDDSTKVRAQVEIWLKEIKNQRSAVDRGEFATLARTSPTWPSLQAQLESASALANARTKYADIRDVSVQLSLVLRDQMDDLLERLVGEYDEEELPLRRDIVKTQAIIDHNGDMVRAQQEADTLQTALDERIDALTMQSYTAIAPDLLGVSVSTQQVSIGAAKAEFHQAVTQHAADYRAKAVTAADITLDRGHSNYATQFNFLGCTVSTAQPQAQAEQLIKTTWDRSIKSYLDAVAFKTSKLILPIIIFAIVTVLAFAISPAAGLVIMVLGGGAVALYAYSTKKKADNETARVQAAAKAAHEYSLEIYRTALGEFVDFSLAYEDADAEEEPLLELIDSWHSAVTAEED